MAETDFKSVDEYIASQPKAVQGVLERVRNIIRKTVPVADEVISYKIPTYKLHGGAVIYFAGWKKHYSLYPATDHVVAFRGYHYVRDKDSVLWILSEVQRVYENRICTSLPSSLRIAWTAS